MCSCVGNFVCITHKQHDEGKLARLANEVIEGTLPIDALIKGIFLVEQMYLKRRSHRG